MTLNDKQRALSLLRQAVQLVLALHEHPEATPPGYSVHLDPMAEAQLRAALTPDARDYLDCCFRATEGHNLHCDRNDPDVTAALLGGWDANYPPAS